MDYRLDLFNAVGVYEKESTEDDCLFILCHNKKSGDCLSAIIGDTEILSALLSTEGYVKTSSEEEIEKLKKMQRQILNVAINILNTDKELKKKFEFALSQLSIMHENDYLNSELSEATFPDPD